MQEDTSWAGCENPGTFAASPHDTPLSPAGNIHHLGNKALKLATHMVEKVSKQVPVWKAVKGPASQCSAPVICLIWLLFWICEPMAHSVVQAGLELTL